MARKVRSKGGEAQEAANRAYENYLGSVVPNVMLTPSEAVQMNRETPNNAFMQNIDGEFFYPEELTPAVASVGMDQRTANNIASAKRFADELSQKQNEFGNKYAVPGFAATMLAPFAIGAGAAALGNTATVGKALASGLNYLQPSKYVDTIAKGLGAASPYAMYSGASTMAGGAADALFDSYWAANAARNAGKTGSVPGEIMNAMDFIPLMAPVGNMVNRGLGAYSRLRSARRANEVADIAAIKDGLYKTTHAPTGEKVYVDPGTGVAYQYINNGWAPFDSDADYIPNTITGQSMPSIGKKTSSTNSTSENNEFDWEWFEALEKEMHEANAKAKDELLSKLKKTAGEDGVLDFIGNLDEDPSYFNAFDKYTYSELEGIKDELHNDNNATSTALANQIEGYLKANAKANNIMAKSVPPIKSHPIKLAPPKGLVLTAKSEFDSIKDLGKKHFAGPNGYLFTPSAKDKIKDMTEYYPQEEIDGLVESLKKSGEDVDLAWANSILRATGKDVPISDLSNIEREEYKKKAADAIKKIRKGYPKDESITDVINSQDKLGLRNNLLKDEDIYALQVLDNDESREALRALEGSKLDGFAYDAKRQEVIDRYKDTGELIPGRADAVWEKVNKIIDEAKTGKRDPLPAYAYDVFGEKFDLPDYMAAFMETDEFKEAYPNGVDFFWRGIQESPNWHKGYTGYSSYFGGDRNMASGYNAGSFSGGKPIKLSTAVKSGESPNVMLMYVPKGEIYTTPEQHGAAWNNMLHDGSEQISDLAERGHELSRRQKELNDEINKLRAKETQTGSLSQTERDELNALEKEADDTMNKLADVTNQFYVAHKGHLLPIRGLGRGVFHTTDEIAAALNPGFYINPDFGYSGVMLRDVQDGNRGNEIIWNQFRGGYPKVVHPDMTMNRRLGEMGYLRSGGDINIKPSHRGRLTELKERTGKSEAELYNDGNLAHKKMVVFARNARKWNKMDLGGKIQKLAESFNGDYGAMLQMFNRLREKKKK